MAPTVLLVDDQRDIVRLLHSALDTLQVQEMEVIECPSGEEAMLEVGRRKIDLLVTDYRLAGMTGVELMQKIRQLQPEVRVVVVTGMSERKAREEILGAGAVAIFDKPIPLADFLDVVERNLGLVRTIFPPETEVRSDARRARISDLVANLRQDVKAGAAILLNDRGLVVARAGDLVDMSLEVSLLSALTAMAVAGLKAARSNRQERLDQYFVFPGGDQDLLLLVIDAGYFLLLAGAGLAARGTVTETLAAAQAARDEIGRALRALGMTEPLKETPAAAKKEPQVAETKPEPEMEALLKDAGQKKAAPADVDAFWEQAAQEHAGKTTDPKVIPYEQARKMGLTPDEK